MSLWHFISSYQINWQRAQSNQLADPKSPNDSTAGTMCSGKLMSKLYVKTISWSRLVSNSAPHIQLYCHQAQHERHNQGRTCSTAVQHSSAMCSPVQQCSAAVQHRAVKCGKEQSGDAVESCSMQLTQQSNGAACSSHSNPLVQVSVRQCPILIIGQRHFAFLFTQPLPWFQ